MTATRVLVTDFDGTMTRHDFYHLTVEELLPKVYWDADKRLFPFAARSLLAGLHKLQEEGRARTDADGRWTPA